MLRFALALGLAGACTVACPGRPAAPARKGKVLFQGPITTGARVATITVTLLPHSLHPDGPDRGDPWMRGHLVEVTRTEPGKAPVVIWRHFSNGSPFTPVPPQWRASVCAGPKVGEIVFAV